MQIGKYEVKRVLAEGLFADVYEAREPQPPLGLGRRVVVKLCSTGDESVRRRFALETQMIAKLGDHANITSAYDMGFEGQSPFLVEEYVSGEDLRQKINRRDDIPLSKKVEYLLQLAKGLQFAHSKGIVHRDIKPENVRIADDGQVKIMDFGIGKVIASEATRLTASGAIVGTLGYLSPEQIRGEADERSDIFAFAVVAYELLTYEHPFPAKSLREQLQVVMTSDPKPLRDAFPDCPAELEMLIGGGLDKEPDRRPQDFGDVVGRLRRILARLRHHDDSTAGAPTVVLEGEELQEVMATTETALEAARGGAAPAGTAVTERLSGLLSGLGAWLAASGKRLGALGAAAGSRLAAAGAAAIAATRRGFERAATALPPLAARLSTVPRWALAAAAVVAAAGLVFGVAFLAGRVASAPDRPAPEPPVSEEPTEPPPPALPVTGRVFVDAFPAAQVARVEALGAEPAAPAATLASGQGSEGAPVGSAAGDGGEALAGVALEDVAPCRTPCSLELEAGSYRLVLAAADTPDREGSCAVDVEAGGTADCRVQLVELTPVEYFRRMGWWD